MSGQQSAPRHGIIRIAFTPAAEPDATVIAPAYLTEAHHPSQERYALDHSTRMHLDAERRTGIAKHLPEPVANAMTTAASGALHAWSWSDDERSPFLSWWIPRIAITELEPDSHLGQLAIRFELLSSNPFMLPYLAHLPADERPDPTQWRHGIYTMVYPVDALPAATHTLHDGAWQLAPA